MSEREEKTPLAPLLPKPDGSEKDYVDSSCPEDIVIKEGNVKFVSLKMFYVFHNRRKGNVNEKNVVCTHLRIHPNPFLTLRFCINLYP